VWIDKPVGGQRRSPRTVIQNCSQWSEVGVLDTAFVALLVGLAALVVGFATACDRLLGPDEPVLAETGREGARRGTTCAPGRC
jgi:hypothetical protein